MRRGKGGLQSLITDIVRCIIIHIRVFIFFTAVYVTT